MAALEKEFKAHFQNYNYELYAIELYQQWIGGKKYRGIDDDYKNPIFQDYFEKLKHKTQIDLIFNRKTEISKNQKALDKLAQIASEQLQAEVNKFKANPFGEAEDVPLLGLNSAAITKSLQADISYINGHRLDLVWSRNLMDTLLGLHYVKSNSVQAVSSNVALLNGVASYGFYFIRGGMDLAKLIRHSLLTEHSELDKHDITVKDKLRLQWGLRYASIINDIILWGPVNLVTFHFLFGMGTLGYFGNLLTAGLLFCDFTLNLYNLIHTQNKFNALKKELEDKLEDKKVDAAIIADIIAALEAQHLKTMRDLKWYVAYSAALCLAFTVLCTLLIPGPGLTVMLLPGSLMFGSLAILGLQIALNLKNAITKYQEAEDSAELKKIAVLEGVARIFSQSLIPASLVLTSLLLPATGLPPMFIAIAALTVSSMLVKIINDLTDRYVLKQEIIKLNKDSMDISSKSAYPDQSEDLSETQAVLAEKNQMLGNNLHQLRKDTLQCSSGIMAITAIGMGLTLATGPLAPLIALPILLALLTLGLQMFLKKPEVPSLALV